LLYLTDLNNQRSSTIAPAHIDDMLLSVREVDVWNVGVHLVSVPSNVYYHLHSTCARTPVMSTRPESTNTTKATASRPRTRTETWDHNHIEIQSRNLETIKAKMDDSRLNWCTEVDQSSSSGASKLQV